MRFSTCYSFKVLKLLCVFAQPAKTYVEKGGLNKTASTHIIQTLTLEKIINKYGAFKT